MSNKTSDKNVANDSVIAHKFATMQQQIDKKDKRIKELQKENEELKTTVNKQSIDISNNLIELQQKDKQIELMVQKIYKRISAKELNKYCNKQKNNCKNYKECFNCIKQYFENKAKGE